MGDKLCEKEVQLTPLLIHIEIGIFVLESVFTLIDINGQYSDENNFHY